MIDTKETIWVTAAIAAICVLFAGMAFDSGAAGLASALGLIGLGSLVASIFAFFSLKD